MNELQRTSFLETYEKASLLKLDEQLGASAALFQALIHDPREIECGDDYELFGSAYFHLGEIALKQDEQDKAEACLEKCLYFYPEHSKAEEYIRRIKRALGKEDEVEALVYPMQRLWKERLRTIYFERWKLWWRVQRKYNAQTIDTYCNFSERHECFEYLANAFAASVPICYLEFGVHKGGSLRWWLKHNRHVESCFYGFDSFKGLPEFWGKFPKGRFDTEGMPPVVDDVRCQFEVGLFQDTLHIFLKDNQLKYKKIIHLDADLYSSTLFVLTTLEPFLNKGDFLMFDEFSGVDDEFRAFLDFQAACGRECKLIAGTKDQLRAVFEIL